MNQHGMCRDDGFGVLVGKWIYQEVVNWRNSFQKQVNKLVGGDYLQFTCEVWLDNTVRPTPELSAEEAKKNEVAIQRGKTFPCLGMELYWSTKGELQFQVHLKPNQQLKYLNDGSVHTKACIKAISEGVHQTLAKLTTITEENQDKTLNEMYPMHFEALSHAGLITKRPK
jgi:hypothetical protein